MKNKCEECKYYHNYLCCKGVAYRLVTVEMQKGCGENV